MSASKYSCDVTQTWSSFDDISVLWAFDQSLVPRMQQSNNKEVLSWKQGPQWVCSLPTNDNDLIFLFSFVNSLPYPEQLP